MTNATSASLLPDEPAPVRLMNTIWADSGGLRDDFSTQAGLHEWLAEVDEGYATDAIGEPSAGELAEARVLRDSLRRLAALATDDTRAAAQSPVDNVDDAVAAVNRMVTHRPHAQLALREGHLDRDRPTSASPARVALADFAGESIDLLTGPDATKLCACHAPGCVRYFVRSNPRRHWCSDACGNRARAARHYRRTRGD